MNEACPNCARSTAGNCGQHVIPFNLGNHPWPPSSPRGWECPKCGTANAPWMPTCGGCKRD